MIRWYDYIAVLVVADLATMFLLAGGIGLIAAYFIVFEAWDYYCEWRKDRENFYN